MMNLPSIALQWCHLFGYGSCQEASTFEAMLMAGAAIVAIFLAFGIAMWVLAVIAIALRVAAG